MLMINSRIFVVFPCFLHSLITSEKVVPILCRRGQKFSVLYKLSVFSVHMIVKHN
nr:MAG TPA: hypothetical protein [Caudoviricetes sp.]